MTDLDAKTIIEKYENIIKEEINVKEVSAFKEEIKIQKIFKPIWSKLSAKYGKDTGKIIQFGKQWNLEELENGAVKVFDWDWNNWVLESSDYEITYAWLDWNDMAVDTDILTKLDLKITPELKKEWVAREISRFLNQMRKDADFAVDDKVVLEYHTENEDFLDVLIIFEDFLIQEALLNSIQKSKDPNGNIVAIFDYEEKNITFSLKK